MAAAGMLSAVAAGVLSAVAVGPLSAAAAGRLSPFPARAVQVSGDSTAEVTFLDVGQGDAAFIRSPEGKVALIDAGPSPELVGALRAHGIETIDLAVASHAHADHIGGMESVIRQMPVRYFMDNGVPHTTTTYRRLLQALRASDVIYLEAVERTIELGSVTLRILPPPAGDPADQNNLSVGVVVEYGDFRALFTGDSERPELQYFLSRGVPEVTLFKVPHHGSDDAVLVDLIAAISPEVAVISCGGDNRYGHPSPGTVTAYRRAGATVLRTDVDGEVQVVCERDGAYSVLTAATGLVSTGKKVRPPGIPTDTLPTAEGAVIPGSGRVVVFAGYGRSDGSSFFMGSGRAVWNNTGDTATLYDRMGRIVGRYVY